MSGKIKTKRVQGAKKIRKRELIPFTRQTASMLNAGMTILTAINTVEDQCKNPGFRAVLKTLREDIESGIPLSESMAKFPSVFDEMYVNMIA
ncbi:MAG: type II secretion system F family protein, partial [Kiritimatiellia bacterium]